MRRILVEFARREGSLKRGGDVQRVSLEENLVVCGKPGADLLGARRRSPHGFGRHR